MQALDGWTAGGAVVGLYLALSHAAVIAGDWLLYVPSKSLVISEGAV